MAMRTSYFKVDDEEAYEKLFEGLEGGEDEYGENGEVESFSRYRDGVTEHAFGAYGYIDYFDEESDSYNMGIFESKLSKIISPDSACIIFSASSDGLRYVNGYATIITRDRIDSITLVEAAVKAAKEILGDPNLKIDCEY